MKAYTNRKNIRAALGNLPTDRTELKDSKATGLYLRVFGTGRAVFMYRYKFQGMKRAYTLPGIELRKGSSEKEIGSLLTKARAVHAGLHAKVKEGTDPAIERDLQAREIATMPTVAQFAETYINRRAKPSKTNKGKKSWEQDKRYLDVDVIPNIGRLALDKVKRSHMIALLDKKQNNGALVAYNRLRALLSTFFNFAIERGHIEINPVTGIKRMKETSKERVLSEDEIRFIWEATNETSVLSPSNRLALRMILITGQRPGEVCKMHESQIQGDAWKISDPKNGYTHIIPLTPLALETIEQARPYQRNGLMFPNSKGNIIGKTILPKCMSRLDWSKLPATPHDLRRTCITGISQLGFNRTIQDKVANHVDNSIGGVYDRHDYMKEKRQALEAWNRKLNQLITGQAESNIVQLRSA